MRSWTAGREYDDRHADEMGRAVPTVAMIGPVNGHLFFERLQGFSSSGPGIRLSELRCRPGCDFGEEVYRRARRETMQLALPSRIFASVFACDEIDHGLAFRSAVRAEASFLELDIAVAADQDNR